MDAFQTLELEPRLEFSAEEIREAFREAGKKAHPDAGGGEGEFAALREASAILTSPSRRLRHWLELRGISCELRGAIDSSLMDLFGSVGTATQQAESAIRKRESARTALAKALVENELRLASEATEAAIAEVDATIDRVCSVFPDIEKTPDDHAEIAVRLVRDLAFLEKWRAGLRGCYSRLV